MKILQWFFGSLHLVVVDFRFSTDDFFLSNTRNITADFPKGFDFFFDELIGRVTAGFLNFCHQVNDSFVLLNKLLRLAVIIGRILVKYVPLSHY